MTDPLRTDDFPESDSYPSPESRATSAAGPSLQSAAEQIGSTVGRAMRAARDLPDRVDQIRVGLRDRMTVIRGGGGSAVKDKVSGLKDAAHQRFANGKERAAHLARRARARAARIADQRPLQVLLGVFAAGVIAGVALRLWRNRD